MIRYIDADAFGREMYHEAFETDTDMQRWDSGCWIRYKLFEELLNKQTKADVRENKQGKWIDNHCSMCGCQALWTFSVNKFTLEREYDFCYSSFCPGCGAEMKEGDGKE